MKKKDYKKNQEKDRIKKQFQKKRKNLKIKENKKRTISKNLKIYYFHIFK